MFVFFLAAETKLLLFQWEFRRGEKETLFNLLLLLNEPSFHFAFLYCCDISATKYATVTANLKTKKENDFKPLMAYKVLNCHLILNSILWNILISHFSESHKILQQKSTQFKKRKKPEVDIITFILWCLASLESTSLFSESDGWRQIKMYFLQNVLFLLVKMNDCILQKTFPN